MWLFKNKHIFPFLWNILKPITNLKTFDEDLSNKKHIQILKSLKGPCQQMFCVWHDFNNIVKWLQIHRSAISWMPKHKFKLWINNSLNTVNGDFPK
jgi:uncharacterized membrane protein